MATTAKAMLIARRLGSGGIAIVHPFQDV